MAEQKIIPGESPNDETLDQYQKLWAIPTYGNNPWIDALSYDSKLVNNKTDIWDSLNAANNTILNDAKAVKINVHFANKINLEDIEKEKAEKIRSGSWSNEMIKLIQSAFESWENVANLKFKEVKSIENADFVYYTYKSKYKDRTASHDPPSKNHAKSHNQLPRSDSNWGPVAEYQEPQYAFFNKNIFKRTNTDQQRGSKINYLLIHEIGHGIGLKHPHDRGSASEPLSIFPGLVPNNSFGDKFGTMSYGLNNLNQSVFTVMSYNTGLRFDIDELQSYLPTPESTNGHVASPMALDIMAAQIKYGYNFNHNKKDNTYKLPTKTQGNDFTFWECIWDTGGKDTIDAGKAKNNVQLSLMPSPLNSYTPKGGMRESYFISDENPEKKFYDSLDKMLQVIAPEGALLGSGFSFINTAMEVINWVEENNNGVYQNQLNHQDYFEQVSNSNDHNKLKEALRYFTIQRQDYAGKSKNFNELYSRFQMQQEAKLDISANHAGGFISKELGVQGGFTIAAGSLIENAIGGNKHDILIGNNEANILKGGDGHDVLEGKPGNDTINGGNGNDVLHGDMGYDQLSGGQGQDIFVLPYYLENHENIYEFDSITDFNITEDKISIPSKWDKTTFSRLTNNMQEIKVFNIKTIHKSNAKKSANNSQLLAKIVSGTEGEIQQRFKQIRQHFDSETQLYAINLSDNTLNAFEEKADQEKFRLEPILKFNKSADLSQITSDNFITGTKLPSDIIYGTIPL